MSDTIQLEVVTPNGATISEAVDIVTAPGYGGDFGVLANHAPFLSTIKIGVLTYKQGSKEANLMVSGGFCEVSNNKITFLVESAEQGSEIDVDRAMRAKERAEKRLAAAQQHEEKINQARAEVALQRAMARIKAARHGEA
ncbi:MAG: F0F1 ATP synthase subunit epsilon [Proteobacteria bacterium]|nr:F0F1 ATP synthase subunit epsilon [Pseudomonadota bacterium]MBU1716806.1 F0F1 ATP synthase subunit epsilon [Pseudomonadota bacterium]